MLYSEGHSVVIELEHNIVGAELPIVSNWTEASIVCSSV